MFDISPEDIAQLDDKDLRQLIARLCEAELRRRCLPTSAVLYGGNQDAADGGVDVRIELPPDTNISGPIPRPNTVFQSKAQNMPESEITKEMRPKVKQAGGTKAPSIRPSIRDLAAVGGAYVIVSSKDSTTDTRLDERRKAMRTAVAGLPNSDAIYLDFYDRTRIATWVRDYPGEILWLRDRIGERLSGWRPYANWSHTPNSAAGTYFWDDTVRFRDLNNPQNDSLTISAGIARLRSILSQPEGIVRLTGLSGTGKTRLLEALFDPAIGDQPLDPSQAVYVDIGHDSPEPSMTQLANQFVAQSKRAILLIDNCPRKTHDAIAPICKEFGSPLSLITVDLDIQDDKPEGTDVFRLQNASETVIESILERRHPALSQAIRRRIADFSGGNARIAILTAQHVSPDTNLADLGDEELFERLFHQKKERDGNLLRAAETLALVYSFDGKTMEGNSAELPFLAELAGLDERTVYRAVAELQRREIIQSRGGWRAILPQPLANRLAKRALQNLPLRQLANTFWQCEKWRLIKSFTHRLSYLHDSDQARSIARDWLATDGFFASFRGLNQLGIDIINHLAPVAPGATLDLIERFVSISSSEVRQLTAVEFRHRGPLMFLLRKLAYFSGHFHRAVWLLSRFVQAELTPNTETQDSRTLEELFWAMLSMTQASPQQRREVVEEWLSSTDNQTQKVGMIALKGLLHARYFSSSYDCSFGAHAVDYGWWPRTSAEYQDWYGGALEIARRLATSSSPHRAEARHLIAEHFRDIWCFGHAFDQLEKTAIAVGTEEHWPEGWLAVRQTLGLDAERMEASLVTRLRRLEARLGPNGLCDQIRSCVLIPAYRIADTGHWETGEEYMQGLEAVIDQARQLGREVGKTPEVLGDLWQQLFGPNAHQATSFGEGFADTVLDASAAWRYLVQRYQEVEDSQRNPSLLGGFLRGIGLKNRALVDALLRNAIRDPILAPVFPFLQLSVGVDQAGVQRLLDSIGYAVAPAQAYSPLAYGRTTEAMAACDLSRILLGIAALPDGWMTAVEILSMHFHGQPGDQMTTAGCLIDCGQQLLKSCPLDEKRPAWGHCLKQIAMRCLIGPDGIEATIVLCERVRERGKSVPFIGDELNGVIEAILDLHPTTALDIWLGPETKEEWLDELFLDDIRDRRPLDRVPTQTLLDWAETDPEVRYPRLARAIPAFKKEKELMVWTELALVLLHAAPDRAAVFASFESQFIPCSWSGSLADLLEERRLLIQQFINDQDPRVSSVAQRINDSLLKQINEERSLEAHRDRGFE
ncbi:MAG: ATP-binding protein [Candidatus Sumerlaeaceae bacterium]|nr:ATP-binding protein [Candidatus Sumerlaeaceae bacterium]